MGREIYMVITGKELAFLSPLPERIAYLGTHWEDGKLTDIPKDLPRGSLLLIDDRVPPPKDGSIDALLPLLPRLSGIYLDFQREDTPKSLVASLAEKIPIPVGAPARFGTKIPVLPPRPLNILPGTYYTPGCWTEAAVSAWELTVTKEGCTKKEIPGKDISGKDHEKLYCRYAMEHDEEKAVFTLQNDKTLLHREILETEAVEKWLVLYRDWRAG